MASTRVVNVRVKHIRPKHHDLRHWCMEPNHLYIGRAGVVFVKFPDGTKQRWPRRASVWANPFNLKRHSREESLRLYRKYILEKIAQHPRTYDIESLRGKTLGCWCKPHACHGDVLCEILASRSDDDEAAP